LSQGTSPSGSYDEGSRSTLSNFPKAATRTRRKRNSDSEDEDYVAIEEEVSSKKKVVKKEFGTVASCRWETTPVGSLGSLLRLAGVGLCEDRVWQSAHKSFTQVRAAGTRKTLILLVCVLRCCCVLELAAVALVRSRVPEKPSRFEHWGAREGFRKNSLRSRGRTR